MENVILGVLLGVFLVAGIIGYALWATWLDGGDN